MDYIFWCVDTQKEFFEKYKGKYPIPMGDNYLDKFSKISEEARKIGARIIHTACWFEDGSEYGYCRMGSEEAKFVEETAPKDFMIIDWASSKGIYFPDLNKKKEIAITKSDKNLFKGNPYSEAFLHNLGVPIMKRPKFIVYGVDIGETVVELMKRGYDVSVIEDANVNLNGQKFKKEDFFNEEEVDINFIKIDEPINL